MSYSDAKKGVRGAGGDGGLAGARKNLDASSVSYGSYEDSSKGATHPVRTLGADVSPYILVVSLVRPTVNRKYTVVIASLGASRGTLYEISQVLLPRQRASM